MTSLRVMKCEDSWLCELSLESVEGFILRGTLLSELSSSLWLHLLLLRVTPALWVFCGATFITPFGRYCFNRLLFGISSAPEHFQCQMEAILAGQEGYMGDVLIFGRIRQEHDARLHAVSSQELSSRGTCQKPLLASSLLNTVAPASWASVLSTFGRGCVSLNTLSFSHRKSTHIRTDPDFF